MIKPQIYIALTWQDRRALREAYVQDQKGKCQHCQRDLNGPASDIVEKAEIDKSRFPKTMFKYPVHLHHDHKTGYTIGAVHARCNAWLWQYRGE